MLAWLLWRTLSLRPLRQMNFGARLFQQKRYLEAAEAFRLLLTRRLSAGLEADTRRRLADTLDVLGETEEAATERDRAEACASGSRRDPLALTAQGDLLKHQHHYDEACKLYQDALSLLPALPTPGRAQIMAKLTIAHFEAGRSGEALKWAEASLANNPAKNIRRMMESMSGVASADQGDLEGAESHYFRALALAEAGGNPEEISRTLGALAGVQYKRGQFDQAISTCHRAWKSQPEPGRMALLIEAECLRDSGRFDEARAVIGRFRKGPRFDQPWVERKQQALGALASAYIEIFAEQPAAALPLLEAAREGLKALTRTTVWPPPITGKEDKISLWCDAAQAAALAGVGRDAEARRLVVSSVDRLSGFGKDRATRLGTYGSLGRAAFALGDLAESEDFWRQYLHCKPNPVSLPNAHFYLGEIFLRRAEKEAALDAFRQAVAPEVDSFYARRAQARLDELS